MPYHNNIPLPGDAKSVSQGQILDNFQYLNDLVLGKNNFILLERQTVAPAIAATQVGLYNLVSGAVNTLVIKDGANAPIDILTAIKAANGACTLPCGIKMAWGKIYITSGATYNFAAAFAGIPFSVQLTAISTGTTKDMLSVYNVTNASFQATSYNANSNFDKIYAYYIAVGI